MAQTTVAAPGTTDLVAATEQLIRSRHSVRAFRPEPVPEEILLGALDLARTAPSASNTQPWTVDVVSGDLRDTLSAALVEAARAGRENPDVPWPAGDETIRARRVEIGALLYSTLGIAREDKAARFENYLDNLRFFGAPHMVLVYVPADGEARMCTDVGFYTQTLLLALQAHGVGSCVQGFIGSYGAVVREVLGTPDDDRKLLFGISIGYPDEDALVNTVRSPRAPLSQTVRMLS